MRAALAAFEAVALKPWSSVWDVLFIGLPFLCVITVASMFYVSVDALVAIHLWNLFLKNSGIDSKQGRIGPLCT